MATRYENANKKTAKIISNVLLMIPHIIKNARQKNTKDKSVQFKSEQKVYVPYPYKCNIQKVIIFITLF